MAVITILFDSQGTSTDTLSLSTPVLSYLLKLPINVALCLRVLVQKKKVKSLRKLQHKK